MIKDYLDKRRQGVNIIHTREELASHVGISHATLYSRLSERTDWEDWERVALKELIPISQFDSNEVVTKMVLKYLHAQVLKYREQVMTREEFAKALNIPVSTLYNRFRRGSWTEEEIHKIKEICSFGGGSESTTKSD